MDVTGKVLSKKARRYQADALTQCALECFGTLKGRKMRAPLNQLILSTFYHEVSVRRATRALRQLKRTFADWNEVRVSHPAEVASALSSAPWALHSSERIVWLLRELVRFHHRSDLDFLHDLTAQQARSCLECLPNVPRPLADEVLLLSLQEAVLPVSATTARTCYRMGILDNPRPTVANQKQLQELFDEQYYVPVHLFFCDRVEKCCLPEAPLCEECGLAPKCPSARQNNQP
ncbi:MAG: hypothetical protein J7M08_00425 [Planctomycetes bacterium]|nr:hypothetical protein [Planctomycetota bacterium]